MSILSVLSRSAVVLACLGLVLQVRADDIGVEDAEVEQSESEPESESESDYESESESDEDQSEEDEGQTADCETPEEPERMEFSGADETELPFDDHIPAFADEGQDIIRQTQQVAPLAPNERLRPDSPGTSPQGSESARSTLGPPTLSSVTAGQGRARLLSRGRATAPAMVGDFFGGAPGASSIVFGTPIAAAATVNNSGYLDDFTIVDGNTVIPGYNCFGLGSATPGALFFVPGAIIDANGQIQAATGLVPGDHLGAPIPGAAPLAITATGMNMSAFNQLPRNVQFDANSPIYAVRPVIDVVLPYPAASGAGLIGRAKIGENTSPMPRDRIFFNYSAFDSVPLTSTGVSVNRFTPGFEKTFFDGMTSFEMRFPFATTLNNNIIADGSTNTSSVLFGNISMAFKALVYTNDTLAVSAGLQMMVPTAPALNVNLSDTTQLVKINNSTVNLMPFVGALYTPDDRFFTQGFLQVDTPANGNGVYVNNFDGNGLTASGTIRDVTYLYADIGTGYWLYRNDDAPKLTGFSTTAELHYNQSLAPTTVLATNLYRIGAPYSNLSMVNAVIGGNLHFGLNSTLTVGYVAPIGNGADQMFDGELRAYFNYRFGPQTFRTRTTL